MTPLHLAAFSGSVKIVKKLLLEGADKYCRNNKKETPLQIAE